MGSSDGGLQDGVLGDDDAWETKWMHWPKLTSSNPDTLVTEANVLEVYTKSGIAAKLFEEIPTQDRYVSNVSIYLKYSCYIHINCI